MDRVDGNGKFSLTVKARGELALYVQFVEEVGQLASDFATRPALVPLSGKQTYSVGTLRVTQEQDGD